MNIFKKQIKGFGQWLSGIYDDAKKQNSLTGNGERETDGYDEENNKEKIIIIDKLADEERHEVILDTVNEDIGEDISESNIQKIIHKLGGVFKQWGFKDGQKDISTLLIESIVSDTANLLKEAVLVRIVSAQGREEIESSANEENVKRVEAEIEAAVKTKKQLEGLYNHDFKQFSRNLGIFYLIASILLLIADLPLAYQITGQGFRLSSDLQKIILAIGIATCTLYIKVFWDRYLGSRLDKISKPIESRTGFDREQHPSYDPVDELRVNHINDAKKIKSTRFAVDLFVLLLTLLAIVLLNIFRFEFLINVSLQTDPNSLFKYISGTLPLWTFILVGTMFPLISGILMSLGLGCIQNSSLKRKYEKEIKELKEEQKKLVEEKTKLKEKKANLLTKKVWFEKENIKGSENFLKSCYLYGYELGLFETNKNRDVFSKVYSLYRKEVTLDLLKFNKDKYNELYGIEK